MAANGIICKVRKLSNILYTQHRSCECHQKFIKLYQWDISQLMGSNGKNLVKYAVIVLNRPVPQNEHFMKKFWNNGNGFIQLCCKICNTQICNHSNRFCQENYYLRASVRMTVDGGTNQWDTFLKKLPLEEQRTIQKPDLVTGDFDSITEDILQKYKNKGCKVIETPDQDHTDFTKALMELNKYCTEHKIEIKHAVAIAQSSGRIDQILGNVQTLYLSKLKQLLKSSTNVYLMSDDAVSWLLFPGDHIIFIPEETRKHKRSWCSLVPVGEVCEHVTTNGLKWNLDNSILKFGELVSTSNALDGSENVTIRCSHTILWSMKVPGIC